MACIVHQQGKVLTKCDSKRNVFRAK